MTKLQKALRLQENAKWDLISSFDNFHGPKHVEYLPDE